MVTDPYREYCRRQHRLLAHHLGIEAWRSGEDCLLVERDQLEDFLELERFKGTRVQWLLEDVGPWFKYTYPVYSGSAPDSLQALFLSRVAIDPKFISKVDGEVDLEELVEWMRQNGLRINLYYSVSSLIPLTEEQLVLRLALLASGLKEP
ncbi:hypothetical protein [Archangium sp.]|uniref:hypothetical protein n=1 Tax=Archangium sp. TaxID=1872627 RepID=UPI00286B5826|nr:hypothetical protein [Archangium sp.]